MRAMKCDRCGKFCEEHDVMRIDTELKRGFLERHKTYDLCPDCMRELEDFLNKKIK